MFKKGLLLTLVGTALLAIITLITTQSVAFANQQGYYSFAVKFVCGVQVPAPVTTPVRPGQYATEINIYNRQLEGFNAELQKKVIFVVRDGQPIGREPNQQGPAATDSIVLLGGNATMDDCVRIEQLTGINPNLLSIGYLVIESPVDLDVNAVYTTGSLFKQQRQSPPIIEVEHIPGVFVEQ